MATLKLIIVPSKTNQDGTTKVRIALCHKHTTAYIITRFAVKPNHWKNGQVVKRPDAALVNTKLRSLLNEYQNQLDSIKHADLYSCAQLKNIVASTHTEAEKTFSFISKKFIANLINEGRQSYATSIERTSRYFLDFLHGDIMLADITPMMIQNFAAFIRLKNVSDATVNTYLAQLKAIINLAIREQLVSYNAHPFLSTKITTSPVRKLDLSLASLTKIIKCNPKKRKLIMAKDLFLISFYLGGMNLIDIMSADFRSNTVEYTRAKTATRNASSFILTIPAEARSIINKWMVKRTGKLDFRYKYTYHNFSQYVTYSLADLAKGLNINERITFYSARKTFAQFASDLGIPDAVIDYCLGHSDKARGVLRYYTQVRQKQADMAISRVIDYTKNPYRYQEYLELRNDIMMMRM